MVKYLFVIFYLSIVMFLKLGHQLAKGKISVSVLLRCRACSA